jgi:hypothetical protein
MNTLKLISEIQENDSGLTILESKEKGDLYIQGIFMQSEKTNRNGRIYPSSILRREIQKYNEEYISKKRSLGELNHPPSPSVDPERSSHLIVELKEQGNDFIGKAKVLSTPVGMIVQSLIKDGVQLGVSSRGLGSLREGTGAYRGSKVVQNDFKFVTVDIVSDPSAPDAWINGIFESVDFIIKNGHVSTVDKKKLQRERDKHHKQITEESKRTADLLKKAQSIAITKSLIDFISNLKVK